MVQEKDLYKGVPLSCMAVLGGMMPSLNVKKGQSYERFGVAKLDGSLW